MRLGKFECTVKEGTLTHKAYGTGTIWERHRHRYEFNNTYRKDLEDAGLIVNFTGSGMVTSQSLSAGSQYARGQKISLRLRNS